MVVYGPWIQDPDYDVLVSWNNSSLARLRVLESRGIPSSLCLESGVVKDGHNNQDIYFGPPPNMSSVFNDTAAIVSEGGGTYDPNIIGGSSIGVSFLANLDAEGNEGSAFDPPYTTGEVTVTAAHGLVHFARTSTGPTGSQQVTHSPSVYPSDDWIDYEWEGVSAGVITDWLAVTLLATSVMSGANSVLMDDSTTHPVGAFSTHILAGEVQVAVASEPTGTGDLLRNLGVDVDLTGHVRAAAGGELLLRTVTPTYVPPRDPTTTGGQWFFGWEFSDMRLSWRVRPPRYRFSYAGTGAVTYRRTFPLDTRRNYPPSKATYAGNRTSGGYL